MRYDATSLFRSKAQLLKFQRDKCHYNLKSDLNIKFNPDQENPKMSSKYFIRQQESHIGSESDKDAS